jgi:formylglycine-generating enzyme required for sulfatase activity
MPKPLAFLLVVAIATVLPSGASAAPVTMAWSPVGKPGNAADPATGSLYGAVGYSYNIGTYDVTASQYVAFLNSNDPTGLDPLGLYNSSMSNATYGSVVYTSGAAIGGKYSVVSGDSNLPINYVTFYDTLRFANWLDNGQIPGSTETGAYTLLGGTPTPFNANSITRNAGATVFLPTENEWYKAAYYNPATSSYYSYATSSNTVPTSSGPTATPNSANYSAFAGNLTAVGAYSRTTSPSGAYDMNGDVFQWNETLIGGSYRGLRGASFANSSINLPSSYRAWDGPPTVSPYFGFRVASVLTPEPSAGVLALIGCGVIWWWRKRFSPPPTSSNLS